MTTLQTNNAELNQKQVLILMEYLTQWLIRSGVGYNDFVTALKPVFYQQALSELERIEQKPTDSAVSLLSGLHRKDVNAFKKAMQAGQPLTEAKVAEPVSVPARVIGLWLAEGLAEKIPFVSNDQVSFENLVKKFSTEKHPRSILNELERLNIVKEEDGLVMLQQRSFMPDVEQFEVRKLLTNNLEAHLAAGVHNLFQPEKEPYLEQAIFADELTDESITILKEASLRLWEDLSLQVLKLAIERCALDEGKEGATKTFRFGAYQYDENNL